MKKIAFFFLTLILMFESIALSVESSREARGSMLFKKHCSACHPDATKIKAGANIVGFMRNPVPPMPTFNSAKVSEKEAQLIADFIKLQIYYAVNK